jgi:hypothetical protein
MSELFPRLRRLIQCFTWTTGCALVSAGVAGALLIAPALAQSADVVFPPGLRIGLAPPPGFVASKNFPGFENAEHRATIIIVELSGSAFDGLEKEIAGELQKSPDLAPQRHDIDFTAGGGGFFLAGRQDSAAGPFLKWTLVGKLGNVTAIVTAMAPEAAKEALPEPVIRRAFGSLTVRATVGAQEQLDTLPFVMADLAGFRLVRVQPGSVAMLTDGPNDDIESADQPLLVISAGMGVTPQPADREAFSRRLFSSVPGLTDVRVLRSEGMRIGGQPGHEVLAEAKDVKTGAEMTAVQWVRFSTGGLIRFVAVGRKDAWPSLFPRLRAVRDGIEGR